jgi:hypothetical protein
LPGDPEHPHQLAGRHRGEDEGSGGPRGDEPGAGELGVQLAVGFGASAADKLPGL